MNIETKTANDVSILILAGRLDAASAPEAELAIDKVISSGARYLALQLAGLEYISSAGLRVLLAAAKKMSKLDGGIALCALQPGVREVFEISGLLSIFPIAEDVTAAQSLAKGGGA